MEDPNVTYFRNLWQINVSDLENWCKVWEEICSDNQVPEDVLGEIRTAIGLARLLMNQKLKQFKGLIDDSEFHTGEKEITCSDLQGFWDMVYFEIEKIKKSFEKLDKCKNNEWKFIEENSENTMKKKVPVKKNTSVINKRNETLKAQTLAARQRIAEARKRMIAEYKERNNQNLLEIQQSTKERLNENLNLIGNGKVINGLADNANDKGKQSFHVNKNAVEKCDSAEECSILNEISKQKAVQKKKQTSAVYNKENLPASNTDQIPSKQTKSKESIVQDVEKKEKTKNFIKLQCVTRSAAKKATLSQQNRMQE